MEATGVDTHCKPSILDILTPVAVLVFGYITDYSDIRCACKSGDIHREIPRVLPSPLQLTLHSFLSRNSCPNHSVPFINTTGMMQSLQQNDVLTKMNHEITSTSVKQSWIKFLSNPTNTNYVGQVVCYYHVSNNDHTNIHSQKHQEGKTPASHFHVNNL